MSRLALFALVWLPVALPLAARAGEREFPADPVELLAGRTVSGDPVHAVSRRGYRYSFATAANRAKFETDPARYEVQWGGACARMGPLSGACRSDIFAVHDGKIWLFASEQCRATFLKQPEKFLEPAQVAPTGDESARRRGRELIELAVKAAGGAAAIDGLKSFRQQIDAKDANATGRVFALRFPDAARDEDTWKDQFWARTLRGGSGGFVTHKGFDQPMVDSQLAAFRRQVNRHPLVILRARTRPEFVAISQGPAELDGIGIQRVAVWFDGSGCKLGIDPQSGRIFTQTFTDRGGSNLFVGTVEHTFVDWKTVDGITLPSAWKSSFDGQPSEQPPTAVTKLDINPPLDEKLFATP